jgi:hypothetical protein
MYQQLWGYKVEEKLYLGGTRTKKVEYHCSRPRHHSDEIVYTIYSKLYHKTDEFLVSDTHSRSGAILLQRSINSYNHDATPHSPFQVMFY